MENQAEPSDPDLRRLILRNLKEWTAALGVKPAAVPVWQFPLRAFEIAAEMAGTESEPNPNPMSAELCLELLAYTPIRLRSCDGVEITTSVEALAADAGSTLIEAIADFENERDNGDLRWEQGDSDGVHVSATIRGRETQATNAASKT
ncbi:hypothetical protein [Nocardia noduli]|uniref:hypothetical protein n=1 Tax=Nocardia noduli TaxID=2815722 RepID=UPI001C238971|nr:hypothetical protein [Nocardia noduli]